jgi:lipopolysaccharide/colanic/teichoic acid biosynthesis glycosyltransferase
MLFTQTRIGYNGIPFTIYKIKTFTEDGTKPTFFGSILRKAKLDELPQLYNLIKGDMVLVGPRPDLPGYADELQGEDLIILKVKPGITGLASLKYRNEEVVLAKQKNPQQYNDKIIWPDKVRINKWYIQHRTIVMDLIILFYTFIPMPFNVDRYIENYKL